MARRAGLLLLACCPLAAGLRSPSGPARESLLGATDPIGNTQAADYERMWKTHMAAVKRKDIGGVQKGYLSGAKLLLYSTAVGGVQTFESGSIATFYKALFREVSGRPVEELQSDIRTDMHFDNNTRASRALRVWRSPSRGLSTVVETLIFVGRGIIRHHVALDCRASGGKGCMTEMLGAVGPVHGAANVDPLASHEGMLSLGQHLYAFSGKKPVLMTVDYPLGSSMLLYDVTKGLVNKSKNTAGMQALSTELWSRMPTSAPKSMELSVGSQCAFNVYKAAKDGCLFGTDTVVLDFKGRFLDQTAVLHCKP